jgi:hypothetical protein
LESFKKTIVGKVKEATYMKLRVIEAKKRRKVRLLVSN